MVRIDKYDGLDICTDCVMFHANGDDCDRCLQCGHTCNNGRCESCDCAAVPLSSLVARNWPGTVIFADDRHRHCDRTCPMCEGYGTACDDSGADLNPCSNCGGSGTMERCPDDCEGDMEGGFSWSSCDSCGSTLGGLRYPYVAIIPE